MPRDDRASRSFHQRRHDQRAGARLGREAVPPSAVCRMLRDGKEAQRRPQTDRARGRRRQCTICHRFAGPVANHQNRPRGQQSARRRADGQAGPRENLADRLPSFQPEATGRLEHRPAAHAEVFGCGCPLLHQLGRPCILRRVYFGKLHRPTRQFPALGPRRVGQDRQTGDRGLVVQRQAQTAAAVKTR